MDRKCKTCAWWDQHYGAELWGWCRYNPPVLLANTHGENDSGWPVVQDVAWCRHWSSTTGWKSDGPQDTPDVDK